MLLHAFVSCVYGDRGEPGVRCMQAPYDVMVFGPSYLGLLEVANAEVVGNVTNGSVDLRITEGYQNLEPDFGNMVNVTLTLATNSQVSSHHSAEATQVALANFQGICIDLPQSALCHAHILVLHDAACT